jgi:hypothetical protein
MKSANENRPTTPREVIVLLVVGARSIGRAARETEAFLRHGALRTGLSLRKSTVVAGEPVSRDILRRREAVHMIDEGLTDVLVAARTLNRVRSTGTGLPVLHAVSICGKARDAQLEQAVIRRLLRNGARRFVVDSCNDSARAALQAVPADHVTLIASGADDDEVARHIARGGSGLIFSWSADGRAAHQARLFLSGREIARTPTTSCQKPHLRQVQAHAFVLSQFARLAGGSPQAANPDDLRRRPPVAAARNATAHERGHQ